jgi:hypothetical protein
MLLRKLLEDAQFLLRKRRNNEAEHRFIYALNKFNEIENFGKFNLKNKEEYDEFNFIIEKYIKKFKVKKFFFNFC